MTWRYWSAGTCLLVACALALVLMVASAGEVDLPGCGVLNGCSRAAASSWGKVPLLNAPIAAWGAACSGALLVGWLVRGGFGSHLVRILAVLAASGSVILILAMIAESLFCVYCLAYHVTFLLFLVVGYPCRGRWNSALRAWVTRSLSVIVIGLVLVTNAQIAAHLRSRHHDILEKSIARIRTTIDEQQTTSSGRFHRGPRNAKIRVLAFIDYECLACLELERRVRQLIRLRRDISFSIRHFPWCADCNRAMEESSCSHRNACLAATAVEAAGMLGGDFAYFQMHDFLVERNGRFDLVDIRRAAAEIPLDLRDFDHAITTRTVRDAINADVSEARRVGLISTPMVFINGVELVGATAENALAEAIASLCEQDTIENTPQIDQQHSIAIEKNIAEWRRGKKEPIPKSRYRWPLLDLGADRDDGRSEDESIRVSLWGDYRDSSTRELDLRVRSAALKRKGVWVEFRHLPSSPESRILAEAVEAAALAGGESGFWAMHLWIMKHKGLVGPEDVAQLITGLGIGEDRFRDLMQSETVDWRIDSDVRLARELNGHASPILYICGRSVPVWKHGQEAIVEEVLAAAAAELDLK